MPCRFASSGTVATSRSASRAILALNVASNFLRDLVISVLHPLRQSRTLHTLTFGPISGVHFTYSNSLSGPAKGVGEFRCVGQRKFFDLNGRCQAQFVSGRCPCRTNCNCRPYECIGSGWPKTSVININVGSQLSACCILQSMIRDDQRHYACDGGDTKYSSHNDQPRGEAGDRFLLSEPPPR